LLRSRDPGSLPFSVTPILRTKRLVLRAWRIEDVGDAFAIWGDPEVVRFLGKDLPVPDLEAQRAWLAPRIERWSRPEWIASFDVWAIADPESDRVIGTTFLKPYSNTQTDRIEIGWHLARAAWGRGLATEAAREVLRYAFEVRKHARVEALVVPENAASIRVCERLGMRRVGRTTDGYDGEELELFVIERSGEG
jgi:[ribosomal protein S5]-alanine N-acetyltransferase